MSLCAGLDKQEILVAPGIYDGLRTASEMTEMMTLIADHTDLPVIIDADTGFGNALNVHRTIRFYQRFASDLSWAVRSPVG